MTSLFFLACVLIAGSFSAGFVVGRVLERWAYPHTDEFDEGWEACWNALGYIQKKGN